MPTYDYRCQSCGQILEAFQKMSDKPLVLCPNCGKETLTRIVSGGAGVIYRGEGWYVTDYSKKSSGGRDETGKPAPKMETKSTEKIVPEPSAQAKGTASTPSVTD